MSDKPDPRLDILLPLFDHRPGFTATVLGSIDNADGRAGVVRVDTFDPALEERLVEARWRQAWPHGCRLTDAEEQRGREQIRNDVRATLAALREVCQ